MKRIGPPILIFALFVLAPATVAAEYSPWSVFGGINYIFNSDGDGVTSVPGMQSNGDPGGLSSAPSPLVGFLGAEYRYAIPYTFGGTKPLPLWFAPSATIFTVDYLWANDRPLPAEIENRTSYVISLLLDMPVVYTIEKDRFLYSFGGGPAILARYGFLDSGVSADAKSYPNEPYTAGEQVKKINSYFWGAARWLYPTIQAGARYKLETGWGAGLTLRIGIPVANLWSTPSVPFADSIMIMAALVITPPDKKSVQKQAADLMQKPAVQDELPSVYDPAAPGDTAGTPTGTPAGTTDNSSTAR